MGRRRRRDSLGSWQGRHRGEAVGLAWRGPRPGERTLRWRISFSGRKERWLSWLPIAEVYSSNPVVGNIYIEHLCTVKCFEKTKINKKGPGMVHLNKKSGVNHSENPINPILWLKSNNYNCLKGPEFFFWGRWGVYFMNKFKHNYLHHAEIIHSDLLKEVVWLQTLIISAWHS